MATYGGIIHVNIYSRVRFKQSTVATYGGVSKLYTIQISFYLLFCFTEKVRGTKTEQSYVTMYVRRIHVYTDQYISNLCILDQNPRLSSYTIGVTYSEYISLLLVCGDFPLTLKTGGCWNLLESTPATIPLIKSSHNSKLGIWLCSQPRIDLSSQSKFYDVLTIPSKYLYNTLYKTTCTKYNLQVSFAIIQVQQFKPIFTVDFTYDCNEFSKYLGTNTYIRITNFTLHLFVTHIVLIGDVHKNTSF